jgi:LPS O-antigen subunit length determinant protein (WzzB/FepE family)
VSSEQFDDEIDLIELLATLWDAKWLIAAITSAVATISVIGALLMPTGFEGSMRISAITNQQMAAYQILNSTPGISAPIYQDGKLVGQTGVVSREDLFSNFLNQLRQGTSFANAHRRLDPEFENFDGTSAELTQKLAEIGSSYVFTFNKDSETSGNKDSETSGYLSFETRDRELGATILKTALNEIREKSRLENLQAISNLRRSIDTSLTFELENVNIELKNALSNYENAISARLALLKEHAAIARQLGNADGLAIASGNSGINVAVEQKQPLYNRGYKALEKEIALIDARGKGEAAFPYVTNYVSLAARKQALETDTRLARIDAGLAATPLINEDRFRAVNYDLDAIVFEATTSKSLIVILATLMGGLIAVIFVLLRSALSDRNKSLAG